MIKGLEVASVRPVVVRDVETMVWIITSRNMEIVEHMVGSERVAHTDRRQHGSGGCHPRGSADGDSVGLAGVGGGVVAYRTWNMGRYRMEGYLDIGIIDGGGRSIERGKEDPSGTERVPGDGKRWRKRKIVGDTQEFRPSVRWI